MTQINITLLIPEHKETSLNALRRYIRKKLCARYKITVHRANKKTVIYQSKNYSDISPTESTSS